ncbi:MAG: nitrogen fixation protein NifX [Thermodesulfovibrionales bacterium]
MKVAFATTDGKNVDEHFGRAGMFAIYDIEEEGFRFVENRKFADGRDKEIEDTKSMGSIHDELMDKKVERLSDCKIVYLTEIGGPAAAKLIKRQMMPIKVKEEVSIEASLNKLLETIKTSPPIWLRKNLKSK